MLCLIIDFRDSHPCFPSLALAPPRPPRLAVIYASPPFEFPLAAFFSLPPRQRSLFATTKPTNQPTLVLLLVLDQLTTLSLLFFFSLRLDSNNSLSSSSLKRGNTSKKKLYTHIHKQGTSIIYRHSPTSPTSPFLLSNRNDPDDDLLLPVS